MSAPNTSILEAALLIENKPLTIERIATLTALSSESIEEGLRALQAKYDDPFHGITLKYIDDTVILVPKESPWHILKEHLNIQDAKKISPALMETLAVIAYKQPVTISEIESLRGVTVQTALSQLQAYNLVRVHGRRNAPGAPYEFCTTEDFLKYFNLGSMQDLPEIDEEHVKNLFKQS